jgi:hypothetical protein
MSYEEYNETELAYRYRSQTGIVLKRTVTKDRIIQLLSGQYSAQLEEISPTTESKKSSNSM